MHPGSTFPVLSRNNTHLEISIHHVIVDTMVWLAFLVCLVPSYHDLQTLVDPLVGYSPESDVRVNFGYKRV